MTEDSPTGNCPCCGRPIPLRATRGGMSVESDPWRVFWRGIEMAGVQPMQVRFLYSLIQRSEVAAASLEMFLGEESSHKGVIVHISHLRRLLRAHRVPARIDNIHGWGYRLRFTEEGGD